MQIQVLINDLTLLLDLFGNSEGTKLLIWTIISCLVFTAPEKWRMKLRAKTGHYRNRCFEIASRKRCCVSKAWRHRNIRIQTDNILLYFINAMLNYTCMLTVLYQLFYLYYPPFKSMVLLKLVSSPIIKSFYFYNIICWLSNDQITIISITKWASALIR